MSFWIISILLSAFAIFCVVYPILRRNEDIVDFIEHDKLHYKTRIDEIDRDLKLGRISADAAEAAKAEEGRKLISISKSAKPSNPTKNIFNKKLLAAIFAMAIPTLAAAIYLPVGNPTLSDQALADRLKADPNDQSVDELLARAEAHLAKTPDDARGWSVVAPVYTRLGRYQDAVLAWSNVLRLAPQFPQVRSLLGEAILSTTDGVVNEQAFKLFEDEKKLNPASARARYYIALGLGQSGKNKQSAEAWEELIAGANPQAPWLQEARNQRDEQRKLAGLPKLEETENQPGPTKEQVAAAQEMSEEDRSAMIENMVSGLAERLEENPEDKAGWQRLIRAYMVLNDKEKALKSIETALKTFQNDESFAQELNEQKSALKGSQE